MTERLDASRSPGAFACGDVRPRGARVLPATELLDSVASPSGGFIADGEYVQTARFVKELPAEKAFRIAQTFAFRGNSVHFRWVEFLDEKDPGAPLYEGVGTYTTDGGLLTIEYANCTTGDSGAFSFEYSASAKGLELISSRHAESLSGRFALQ